MADSLPASLAVISVGTTVYTSFCPPFPKVLAAQADATSIEQVRTAEMFAGTITLGTGGALAVVSKSRMPFAVALTTVIAMTLVYEVSLRKVIP